MQPSQRPPGTFAWHNATQFTGALNDNLFKLLIIYALATAWPEKSVDSTLALVGVVFAVPFLLFLGAGGILADRFAKNRVVRGVKLAEVAVMVFGVFALYTGSGWMMVATMFLMSTQSALFGPTKYGIIPELVGREGISRANSFLQSATYAAIILGTAMAPEVSLWLGGDYALAAFSCVGIAVAGYLCARKIAPVRPSGGTRSLSNLFYRDLLTSLRTVNKDSYLALAVYGSAAFSMVGAYVQMNFLSYGETVLGLSREEATRLFFVTAIGIGAGALLAGRLSRRSIEFGIVPVGTGLMALSCALIYTVDASDGVGWAALWGFCMGVGAGLFLVPIESFVQYRSPPERVGGIVAASAWLSWVGVLLGAVLLFVNSSLLGLDSAQGFLFLALLLVALTMIGILVLPDFFGRFFVFLVARVFYRLRATGRENIPSHGPALLVANHASFMDGLWILALQPRRVRFLVSRRYVEERGWLLRRILRIGRIIPVGESDSPKVLARSLAEARDALRDGYLVGVFPEGRFTRTGHLLPFRSGFERIVRGTGAPVIPLFLEGAYRTGAGLGIFDKPRLFRPGDFRRTVHVAIGPPVEEGPDLATRARAAVEVLSCEAYRLRVEEEAPPARLVRRSLERRGAKAFFACAEGKPHSGYEALELSRKVAGAARRQTTAGERIGILVPPGPDAMILYLGLVLAGRLPVPLDPRTSVEGRVDLHGIVAGEYCGRMDCQVPKVFRAADWLCAQPNGAMGSSEDELPPGNHLASSIRTALGLRDVLRLRAGDNLATLLPLWHPAGEVFAVWLPLMGGLPVWCGALDGSLPREAARSTLSAFPEESEGTFGEGDFPDLRWAASFGGGLLETHLAQRLKMASVAAWALRVPSGETVLSVNVPDADLDGFRQAGARRGTVGRVVPGQAVRIADGKKDVPLPQGMVGRLQVLQANEAGINRWGDTGRDASIDGEGFLTLQAGLGSGQTNKPGVF